jgi:hypothetical protein
MDVRRFVLLFEGRSGSSWVTEILEGHLEVAVDFEPLAAFPGGVQGKLKERDLAAAARLTSEQVDAARASLTRVGGNPVAAAGFNTKLSDVLDLPAFGSLLRETRAQIILLMRRNLVKQTVSLFRAERLAEATGEWNLYDEADCPPAFAINPGLFDEWLRTTSAERERLRQFAIGLELPMLCVYYEDLLSDRERALDLIFSFLGVEYNGANGRARKNTSADLREAVTNFDELRSRYVGTEYEPMFDETPVRT